jgi:hypothetical protein
MSVEINISVKDADRKLTKNFLIYEPVTMDIHDPHIDRCLTDVLNEFKGTPDDVKIKAIMWC